MRVRLPFYRVSIATNELIMFDVRDANPPAPNVSDPL